MLFDERRPLFVLPVPRLLPLSCVLALLAPLVLAAQGAEPTYDLRVSAQPGQVQRVRALLEVDGQLRLSGEDGKVTKLPLKVAGELLYDERVLEFNQQNRCRKDLRCYDTAQADLRIGDTTQRSTLHADRRLAVAQVDAQEVVLFSPLAPFTRDELELLEIQANSAALFRLAPERSVAIGDTWNHDGATIAALLCLDAVTQSDVKSTLRQVEDSVAIVDLAGAVSGKVRSMTSEIQCRGKYNVDLKRHCVTWLALSITENRASSAAEPGFEVEARLRQVIAPVAQRGELSDDSIAGLTLDSSPATTLLALSSGGGGFQLLHNRQWRVMADRSEVTILRLMAQGDLIAQCNASRLADLPAGQRVQLESFQADVQRALGEHFSEFREASQETTAAGLRVLRLVASGLASELPVQWTYYHVSDDQGRQAALVFTMDSRMIETFGDADRAMIDSFQFARDDAAPSGDPATANAATSAPAPPRR